MSRDDRSLVSDFNKYLFNTGKHFRSYEFLGAHLKKENGELGTQFTVWAPRAKKVFVSGVFNNWQGYEMHTDGKTGIWTAFIPGIGENELYKYKIVDQNGIERLKSDPFAFSSEERPNTASVVKDIEGFNWTDKKWIEKQKNKDFTNSPMNIYEVHLGSWKKHVDNRFYSYKDLVDTLIPYVKEMGYTHIELMPVMEHPLDASWGYQIIGYFSINSRFGSPKDLMHFINKCHENDIGVLLDWVPAHFCKDSHGLISFDGTPTFEYEDPNKAENIRWGTMHFDFGKSQVHSFLISNAIYWLEKFHVDGLRVDAVSSMIYLDYDDGPWTPNIHGGNTNLEAIDFIQKMNDVIKKETKNKIIMAEESTSFPMVTGATKDGGLGFDFKWNMGWMNDILKYIEMGSEERKRNHNLLTFSFMYVFTEKFILPFSHDEVVHGKKSLLNKMPGNEYEKFKGLRLLMTYMICHPGKKINFMGNEIAQWFEWRFDEELEWVGLEYKAHKEHQDFIKMLNNFYLEEKALFENDHSYDGIEILDGDNNAESIITFIRKGKTQKDNLFIAANFGFFDKNELYIKVDKKGIYEEVFNTSDKKFNAKTYKSEINKDNNDNYILVDVESLSIRIFKTKKVGGVLWEKK
ncbi:MAG: 1,4-alpha-glucan branching protein GlgB [Clostridium sp.]|nr:1,4-alpha-glucan branching protein GlgB [Clostridium sp.]